MDTKDKLTELLNDLVRINNDRIDGYEKAITEVQPEDLDLKGLFTNMANESREYVKELSASVKMLGDTPASDSTTSGKIYRAWMDLKAVFTGKDRKSILGACEYGEDAAQKAYDAALASDVAIDADTRQLIVAQKNSLEQSHDVIKKYRDLQPAM